MGENTFQSQEKNVQNVNKNSGPPEDEVEDFMESDDIESMDEEDNDDNDSEEIISEEFQMLNNKLDEINVALDTIEQKNNNIYAEFLKLLEENRSIRQQILDSQKLIRESEQL